MNKKTILIIFYSLIFISFSELPNFASNLCKGFNIPIKIADNWSMAESTHNPYISSCKQAHGRYMIKFCWFKDYLRYNDFKLENIKDPKAFLLNDYNNTYIAYWSYAFWCRLGFDIRNFLQIWLYGLKGVYRDGRWSYSYEKKILGYQGKKKLNWESYKYLIRYE